MNTNTNTNKDDRDEKIDILKNLLTFDSFHPLMEYFYENYKDKVNFEQVYNRIVKLRACCIEDDYDIDIKSLRNFLFFYCKVEPTPTPVLTVSDSGLVYADWEITKSISTVFLSVDSAMPVIAETVECAVIDKCTGTEVVDTSSMKLSSVTLHRFFKWFR